MTASEQKTIDQLNKTLVEIKEENRIFKENMLKMIESMNTKVDKKHLPISLEEGILQVSQAAVNKSILEVLTKYDSPLVKLTNSVINDHSIELKELINSSFEEVIRVPEFKQSIVNAFSHKIAKSIISNNDGLFDKVSNELKQDPIFKSKMTLAVSNIVEECLTNKK